MLQGYIFAVLFGVTLNLINKESSMIKKAAVSFNDLFLKMIEIVMYFAPYGAFLFNI